MNQTKAVRMFETAKSHCEKNYVDELEWANSISPETFKNLKSELFLKQYCWVFYASGFRVSIIKSIFPNLKSAFQNFNLADLSKMESIQPVLDIFNLYGSDSPQLAA
jgi:hypothetical protein